MEKRIRTAPASNGDSGLDQKGGGRYFWSEGSVYLNEVWLHARMRLSKLIKVNTSGLCPSLCKLHLNKET